VVEDTTGAVTAVAEVVVVVVVVVEGIVEVKVLIEVVAKLAPDFSEPTVIGLNNVFIFDDMLYEIINTKQKKKKKKKKRECKKNETLRHIHG
jgi:hypothetical protein